MRFPSQNTPKSMLAGALPQTQLGELTALPQIPTGFKGTDSRQEGWRGEGERTGKGGWNSAPSLLGDRRPCCRHDPPRYTYVHNAVGNGY